MKSYVFVCVEVRTRTIHVRADNYSVAMIKATVGDLEHISQKEGVEISADSETATNTFLVREEEE